MILAGGRGSRLHDLTNKVAKPAVSLPSQPLVMVVSIASWIFRSVTVPTAALMS